MARQPVQLPSRGGASAAGVGSRANYLRPAKDTQNSRALASAFSQMNRAFGRIAANEQRIANQQLADELQMAEEEQKLAEQRAAYAGQMDSLTGQDRASAYATNPAAQQSYFEGKMQAEVAEALVGIGNDARAHEAFGDPLRQEEFKAFVQDQYSTALRDVDPLIVGGMMQQISSQNNKLLLENDTAVYESAKAGATTAMASTLYSSLITGDAASFIATAEFEKENVAQDMSKAEGNKITVAALVSAIRRAAGGSEEDWMNASEAYADLLANPEFMTQSGLNTDQQQSLRDAFSQAEGRFSQKLARLERAEKAKLDAEVAALDDELIYAFLSGNQNQMSALESRYAQINPRVTTYTDRYDNIIKNLGRTQDNFLEGSDAGILATSSRRLALAKHYLDVNNLDATSPDRLVYIIQQANGRLTEKDFNELLRYKPNMGVEAFNHQAYKNFRDRLGGLNDLIVSVLPEGDAAMKRLSSDFQTAGFDEGSPFKRQIEAYMSQFLTDNQGSYPTSYEAQKGMINDAAQFAIEQFLAGTQENGTNLLVKLRDDDDLFSDDLMANPVFRAFFIDSGYEQQYQAALARRESNIDMFIENAMRGIEIDDEAETSSFSFQDSDGDGISDAREQIFDEPAETAASGITRETLNITRVDRERQDDGGKVPASIRTFNFGAIGNVSDPDAKENFEAAFAGKTLGSQDLPGLDGSDVETTAFQTPEDGIRYFGWWMAYRGNPETIDDLADKYYTDSDDASEWAERVSQYSGLDRDEEITADNMDALANGVFSHEAGPSAWTATKINTSVDMAALIEEGKRLYEDNK